MNKYVRTINLFLFLTLFFNITTLFNNQTIENESKKYLISKQDFISTIAPLAVEDMKTTGVYASVTIGQAIEESGWGESKLSSLYNNYFGMSGGACTTANQVRQSGNSNEFWSGMEVCMCSSRRCAWRRVYDSLENSVRDHSRNLWCGNSGKYVVNGVFEATTPKQQLELIRYSGYASSTTYVENIFNGIITPNNLTQYDTEYKKTKPGYANTCTNATYSGTMPTIPEDNSIFTYTTSYDGNIKEGYIYKKQLGNAITELESQTEEKLKNKITNIIGNIYSNASKYTNIVKSGAAAYIANVTYLAGTFKNQIIYFNQGDYANYSYGSYGTIKSHGCGPTSMAIVASSFKGTAISPVETTNYACSHGYCTSAGSSHAVVCALASQYGLGCTGGNGLDALSSTNQQQVVDALASGNSLVVVLAKQGHFTRGGHFFVLTGIDSSGNITVADPGNRANNNKTFTLNYLINPSQGHITKFWIISG